MSDGTASGPRIPLWVDLRHVPVNKRLPYHKAVADAQAEHVLLAKGDPHLDRDGPAPLAVDGKGHVRGGSGVVARMMNVHDRKSQEKASHADGTLIVAATDWKVIPLENLVAARTDRPGTLFALATSPGQARLFALALETGVHGIVLAPNTPADILETDRQLRLVHGAHALPSGSIPQVGSAPQVSSVVSAPLRRDSSAAQAASSAPRPVATPAAPAPAPAAAPAPVHAPGPAPVPAAAALPAPPRAPASAPTQAPGQVAASSGPARIKLEPATVTAVEDGGMGDRVCIDTTSLFGDAEGLLVGSTAASLALVRAETSHTQFLPSRPFRVNAGAVHAYVLCPEGRTKYLSELAAGHAVLAATAAGTTRPVTVGRCKVERRPHTLVRWRTQDGVAGMAVLQTAETVCLLAPDGVAHAITSLAPGASILVHRDDSGRHAGMPVDSFLAEH